MGLLNEELELEPHDKILLNLLPGEAAILNLSVKSGSDLITWTADLIAVVNGEKRVFPLTQGEPFEIAPQVEGAREVAGAQ